MLNIYLLLTLRKMLEFDHTLDRFVNFDEEKQFPSTHMSKW